MNKRAAKFFFCIFKSTAEKPSGLAVKIDLSLSIASLKSFELKVILSSVDSLCGWLKIGS